MDKKIEQEINQRLEKAIRQVIDQQIAEKDPIETLLTYERLVEDGFSETEAYALIGKAVGREVAEMIVMEKPLDLMRFTKALEELPKPFALPKKMDEED